MGTRPSRAHPTASPPSAFRGRPAAPVWFAGSEVRREDAANGGRDLSATGRRHRQAPALPIPRLQRTEDSGRAATWDGVSGEPPETAGEPPALPIPRLQRTGQRSGSHLERVSGEPPETAGEPPALPIPRLQRTEDRGRAATWDGVSGEPPALPRLPLRAFAVQLRRRRQSCRATNPASARPPKATVPGSGTTSISSPQFTSWL